MVGAHKYALPQRTPDRSAQQGQQTPVNRRRSNAHTLSPPQHTITMIKKMSPPDSDFAIPAKNCYRMVILGSTKVGKSAIVSRFLNGRFDEQYTPTIEDFHRKLYSIKGDVYQLDILDTSGNHPFPAMRRLSILTGTLTHVHFCHMNV